MYCSIDILSNNLKEEGATGNTATIKIITDNNLDNDDDDKKDKDPGSGDYKDFGYTDYLKKLSPLTENIEEQDKAIQKLGEDWKNAAYNAKAYNQAAKSKTPINTLLNDSFGLKEFDYDTFKTESGFTAYEKE